MKNNCWHQLTNLMAGVALSWGALMVATPKVDAAVLTYNFITGFGYSGSFSFDSSQAMSGGGAENEWQTFKILEGVFNYQTVDEFANFVPKAYDLTGRQVRFWLGQLLGLEYASGAAYAERVINFEHEGEISTLTYRSSLSWSLSGSYGSFVEETWVGSGIYWNPHYRIRWDDSVEYFLVGESHNPKEAEGEPIPEPATLFGTALGVGGLMRLKQRKKVAASLRNSLKSVWRGQGKIVFSKLCFLRRGIY